MLWFLLFCSGICVVFDIIMRMWLEGVEVVMGYSLE